MKPLRTILIAVLAVILLEAPACVELCGQRVTLRYDAGADRLDILVHYDGVHDSGSTRYGDGKKQLPEFVRDGDVLFLDWPFHVKLSELRKVAANDTTRPALAAFVRAVVDSVGTRALGHYRDPHGRLGAAQLIVVREATAFFRKANAAISEAIISEWDADRVEPSWKRTCGRLLELARTGHAWLRIEGHSLVGSFAVHAREWARGKALALASIADEISSMAALDEEKRPAKVRTMRRYLQAFAAATLSYSESGGQVTVRLGDPATPTTFRFNLRDAYGDDLEEVLVREVPARLDEELAKKLLGEAPAGSAEVLAWGPPEETVRVLVGAAEGADGAARDVALERLATWGEAWNREQGLPPAPAREASDTEGYLDAWREWYRLMLVFPLGE